MELTYLRLKNFLSFKELKHKFVNEPVLIKGKNLTEIESKETNGAGKSTMEAGIAYAILANSLKKQTLDRDLILWGEEEADIWLDIYCPIRKETLNIHRTLRQKGSASLELMINEEEGSVQVATVNDGNAYILNWIGISSEDLKSFYILNKENFKSFVSSSNSDKLSLINRFIKAEQLDDSDSVIKEKIKPLEEKKAVALGKVQKIEGELGVYETQLAEERERNLEEERQSLIERINERIDAVIQEYDGAEKKIENSRTAIKLAEQSIKDNQKKVAEASKKLEGLEAIDYKAQYDSLTKERSSTDTKVEAARKKRKAAQELSSQYTAEANRLTAILKGTVKCPKCGTEFVTSDETVDVPTTRKKIESQKKEAETQENLAKTALEELNSFEERVKKYDDKFMKIRVQEQGTVRAIREVQAEITKIRGEITRSNQMISSYQEDIKHQEGIQSRCNSESEQLVEHLEKAEQAEMETKEAELEGLVALTKKKLEKANKEYGECEKQVSDMVQWGLRFKEFKMSLACEQLRIIQNFANMSLQKQRSELRLSIDGFKRNAKGKIKEEITVSVINGEGEYKSFWSFSGGERARIEMALIQAFQEMINGTNQWGGLHFLMIDEVLEGADPLGLALLLESMSDVHHPVYVISHVMNIRAGVTTLTVVKENGYSYIE